MSEKHIFYHFNVGLGALYGPLLFHTLPASVNGTAMNALTGRYYIFKTSRHWQYQKVKTHSL
jgi:hypothetical protein